jgi:hypothetical protein
MYWLLWWLLGYYPSMKSAGKNMKTIFNSRDALVVSCIHILTGWMANEATFPMLSKNGERLRECCSGNVVLKKSLNNNDSRLHSDEIETEAVPSSIKPIVIYICIDEYILPTHQIINRIMKKTIN